MSKKKSSPAYKRIVMIIVKSYADNIHDNESKKFGMCI